MEQRYMGDLSQYRRELGSTGLQLSPVGLGTVKFGRNQDVKYPVNFELPSEEFLANLLDFAKNLGINTLDTAPAYGKSEERLGRLLKDERDDWIIIGKAGEYFEDGKSRFDFSAEAIERSVHDSLACLDTDYIDALLIHSDGNDLKILEDETLIKRLYDMKSQGIIKAHGISSKTVEGGKAGVDLLDCVMATYNPSYMNELPVLEKAEKANKGILLKKALASGHVETFKDKDKDKDKDPVLETLNNAFSQPAVASVIIGSITPDHIRSNVEKASKIFSS